MLSTQNHDLSFLSCSFKWINKIKILFIYLNIHKCRLAISGLSSVDTLVWVYAISNQMLYTKCTGNMAIDARLHINCNHQKNEIIK